MTHGHTLYIAPKISPSIEDRSLIHDCRIAAGDESDGCNLPDLIFPFRPSSNVSASASNRSSALALATGERGVLGVASPALANDSSSETSDGAAAAFDSFDSFKSFKSSSGNLRPSAFASPALICGRFSSSSTSLDSAATSARIRSARSRLSSRVRIATRHSRSCVLSHSARRATPPASAADRASRSIATTAAYAPDPSIARIP